MKKIIVFSIAFFMALTMNAQFSIGPKVGYTSSKLSIDQSDISSSFKNSFMFGAFVRLGNKLYIQPEVNWYTSGSVFKPVQIGSLSPFEQEITLSNVQIPLFVGLELIDLKLVKLRATAGPTANFVINKTIETFDGSNYTDPIKESDINDIHWGFQFGAGVDVLMLTLDVQYVMGLSNLIETINIDSRDVIFDSKNNGFVVTLGWKIL
jgi:hypothetical protein